jgi:hypothetical protein
VGIPSIGSFTTRSLEYGGAILVGHRNGPMRFGACGAVGQRPTKPFCKFLGRSSVLKDSPGDMWWRGSLAEIEVISWHGVLLVKGANASEATHVPPGAGANPSRNEQSVCLLAEHANVTTRADFLDNLLGTKPWSGALKLQGALPGKE